MSRRRRSRTSLPSSQPSSLICKKAEPDARTKAFEVTYADGDEDCIELHRFLCIVAQGVLFAPIDPAASMAEVIRVRDQGAALMVKADGHLIGTLGLVKSQWWYNPEKGFLTDRWYFLLPQFHHSAAAAQLLGEASAIATQAGLDLVINGHMRRKAKALGRGVIFTHPIVVSVDTAPERLHS